ncbi:MAG: DNA-3-methyladenine glycosylase I [Pseudomonadales bacterium]|nr:DNA-3-methyladenine glycosylase I [Pseudomonadales bacterium]
MLSVKQLEKIPDDRYLAMMTRCVFNAGFHWRVISNKWPGFEAAFHGFNPRGLAHMPPEAWEAYVEDSRIVRNWTKIKSVLDNAHFMLEEAQRHGSFAAFIAHWPASDQVGLLAYLKQHGSRLGGNTGMYFLRFMGKDSFILSRDVIARLQASGLAIRDKPGSKKELGLIQAAFNTWHAESGLPYTHLSSIAAFSIGENYPNPEASL